MAISLQIFFDSMSSTVHFHSWNKESWSSRKAGLWPHSHGKQRLYRTKDEANVNRVSVGVRGTLLPKLQLQIGCLPGGHIWSRFQDMSQ